MSGGRCPAPAAVTLRRLDEHVEKIALDELARLAARPAGNKTALDEAREQVRSAERELERFLVGVEAAGIDPDDFAAAAKNRRVALEEAREAFAAVLASQQAPAVSGDPTKLWHRLDGGQRNRLLRSLIEVVLVQRAGGRGRITPLNDRVRVVAQGAGLVDTASRRGGTARPIETIALPDRDHPAVLGMNLPEQ
jgi:hypothetical protein